MTTIPLELKLPDEKIKALTDIAHARQVKVDEILATVITEWLEQEIKRQHAWKTLHEFSGNYASNEPNNTIARDHDKYLYGKP
jgi:hypothetical protein